jgi:hypothetical protein
MRKSDCDAENVLRLRTRAMIGYTLKKEFIVINVNVKLLSRRVNPLKPQWLLYVPPDITC